MTDTHTIVDYNGPCANRSGDYVIAGDIVDGEVALRCTVCDDLVYASIIQVSARA
ncbi:hypothetical protein [Gordonia otitidis]|uniref:Uncharacterized protein n=1 Tax=Gordonia otitidis (strain DSM 44809 / CCUG 52243 / JCM 12355 / NBRC 100426 / IFM 10032) TaxID=1108044 RepID=H5TSM0_GORO1|nr:hypothetical protein [Gordonia otitidis]GAB36478.1 hypothetical protein GOOTI_221_00210 [Gordonia otitidis NBRC 100426]